MVKTLIFLFTEIYCNLSNYIMTMCIIIIVNLSFLRIKKPKNHRISYNYNNILFFADVLG